MRRNLLLGAIICFIILGLVRYSICTTFRDVPRNRDIVALQQTGTWKNQKLSQSSATTNAGVLHNTNSNNLQFDNRISDMIADNVLTFAHYVGQYLGTNTHFSKSEVFSPLSVMSALALLMLGAKGSSYQQLKQVFGLDSNAELLNQPSKFHTEFGYMLEDLQTHGSMRPRENANWRNTNAAFDIRSRFSNSGNSIPHNIKLANGIFTQRSFSLNPDYKYIVNSVYRSELAQLDFNRKPSEARDYINNWVAQNTYGKIVNIIDSNMPRSTNVIIASALYFKAFWENTFLEAATSTDNFYPDGAHMPPVKVKMMATGGVYPFYQSTEYNCRIIGLPYTGNETTMYVIQPNQSTRTILKEFQRFMDARKIEHLISKMTKQSVILAFPKMRILRKINMRNILYGLGITDIFTNGLSDLSLIGSTSTYAAASASVIAASRPLRPQYAGFDKFQNTPLIFNRFAEIDNDTVTSSLETDSSSASRTKRQARNPTSNNQHLEGLEAARLNTANTKADLFVDDIVHKIYFDVNEYGTEAAAATVTTLKKSTEVLFRVDTPFLLLIRHDPTKLILFYGIINEPEL